MRWGKEKGRGLKSYGGGFNRAWLIGCCGGGQKNGARLTCLVAFMMLPVIGLKNPEEFKVPMGLPSGPLLQAIRTEFWSSTARYTLGWRPGSYQQVDDVMTLG